MMGVMMGARFCLRSHGSGVLPRVFSCADGRARGGPFEVDVNINERNGLRTRTSGRARGDGCKMQGRAATLLLCCCYAATVW